MAKNDPDRIMLIGRGIGEIVVTVLVQVADMEWRRIVKRCDNGRAAARAA